MRCDQSRKSFCGDINTCITGKMYVDSALYLDTMNDIHTHNEYAFFFILCVASNCS